MQKNYKILIAIGVGIITVHFGLAFFGVYLQPEDFCNYEFKFQYDEENEYVNPVLQVQQYLLKNYEGEIDVNNLGGYGIPSPKSDPSKPQIWIIQFNYKQVKNPEELEFLKQSLENNPKIHDLTGPVDLCPKS